MASQHASGKAPGSGLPLPNIVAGVPLAAACVTFALAYLCIEISQGVSGASALWLPNAVALAMLLRAGRRFDRPILGGVLIGIFAANLLGGASGPVAAGLAIANLAEVALAMYMCRRFARDELSVARLHHLMMIVVCAIAAPVASAALSVATLAMVGGIQAEAPLVLYLANGLGILIVTPLCLIFADMASGRLSVPERSSWEWAGMTAMAVAGACAIFGQTRYPLLFLADVIMVAFAFRLGLAGTAIAMTVVSLVATIATLAGSGPVSLVRGSATEQFLVLQTFLGAAFAMSLPVSAVLDRRKQEHARQSAEQRELALLTENISDAVLRFDRQGICTYASPSTLTILDTDPVAYAGRPFGDRAHADSHDTVLKQRALLYSGARETLRFTYRRSSDDAEGAPVYIEADCAATRDAATGEMDGIIVSARDVTDRVMLERQLKRARRHAENAARAKAQFLANMSHEIRTPMNGVLGFADLLRQMPLEDDAARYASLIERSGRSMMMLLNDILDISKIESGQLVLSFETFDPRELVDDCVQLHRAVAEQKRIALTLTCADDIPRSARCDPHRLQQILLNLIANAVKFTEHGSVDIAMRMQDDRLIVTVDDTGIGISPKRIDAIFGPFIQAESSTTRRFGGTGLGLSISRQLADLLGGSLAVESKPDVGSKFTLCIPLERIDAGQAPAQQDAVELPVVSRPRQGRVLLAEDNDINRMLVVAMLEQMHQNVTVAHDGIEADNAVQAAFEAGQPFDLVLMDVQMPLCDGYAATRMIRERGIDAAALPIVALTANAYAEDVSAALEAGMQDHVSKPLVYSDLADTLARWLPTTIVDESKITISPAAPAAPATAALSAHHSPDMLSRWSQRRSEAVDAVSTALRNDDFEGVRVEKLARVVHKLAGTAGMFGEDELGDKAAALERALRANVETDVRRRLAHELLQAA